ncbi:hypothetical protein [Allochromatium vinosum]|uniref:hypothetical protein n=1 Tax=Allochromatium vinosum TaxID=1049 RepID=UPI0019087F9E|nr:hypothetical protein [Allochromatium vinosum]MBK1656033.1 hypothetical protein [Allochromatium vinosum]
MIDLRQTIAPKSDQLNADDLIGGPITIRVTRVSLCAEPDQPIAISFEGDNGKPYKPCKSMRRLLVSAWGPDGSKYINRLMTIFRDERVKFGGAEVGGIRISHMSGLDKPITIALTVAKSVRRPYQVKPLRDEPPSTPTAAAAPTLEGVVARIEGAETEAELQAVVGVAGRLADEADRSRAREAYRAKLERLRAGAEGEQARAEQGRGEEVEGF